MPYHGLCLVPPCLFLSVWSDCLLCLFSVRVSSRQCLPVGVSFSIYFGPFVLTNSGSGSLCVAFFGTNSRASQHFLSASAPPLLSSSVVSWWASLSGLAGTSSLCVTCIRSFFVGSFSVVVRLAVSLFDDSPCFCCCISHHAFLEHVCRRYLPHTRTNVVAIIALLHIVIKFPHSRILKYDH